MGMSKSFSPLETNEYPIHPSPRRTVTTRVWRNEPPPQPLLHNEPPQTHNSKVESDYETMLPQLGKLNLTESPITRRPLPRHPCSPLNQSPSLSSTLGQSPSPCDKLTSPTSTPHKYVVFKDKSKLFMPSPISKVEEEPTYVMIDDSWFDNDRSTDSGFSDRSPEIYDNTRTCMTSDDISLISRYQRVLGNRTKKSRFKKLSEYLCSGGSNSDDEVETDDSLYDSLVSSSESSYNAAFRPSIRSADSFSNLVEDTTSSVFDSPVSSPDETTVRYSKKHFFYTPVKKLDLHSLSTHSEYVLPENFLKTPSSSRLPKPSLTASQAGGSASPLKPQRKAPKSITSPLCHDYENLNMIDFTKPRRAKQQKS